MPLARTADGRLYSGLAGVPRETLERLPTSTFLAALASERARRQRSERAPNAGTSHAQSAENFLLSTVDGLDISSTLTSAEDIEEKLCEICQHAVSRLLIPKPTPHIEKSDHKEGKNALAGNLISSLDNSSSFYNLTFVLQYEREDMVTHLPCAHFFHCQCISQWLDRTHTCPKCRSFVETAAKSQVTDRCAHWQVQHHRIVCWHN
jgi:hypothetical protein